MTRSSLQIAHIGVAVSNITEALAFYRDVLGLEPGPPEKADGARIVPVSFGDIQIELLEPAEPDGPIRRYIDRRGPGIHHICVRVPDLDRALEACREQGYQLIDETPRTGASGCRIAFIHPRATSGILIELTE